MNTVLPERDRPVTPIRTVGVTRPEAKSAKPPAAMRPPSIKSENFTCGLVQMFQVHPVVGHKLWQTQAKGSRGGALREIAGPNEMGQGAAACPEF